MSSVGDDGDDDDVRSAAARDLICSPSREARADDGTRTRTERALDLRGAARIDGRPFERRGTAGRAPRARCVLVVVGVATTPDVDALAVAILAVDELAGTKLRIQGQMRSQGLL